MGDIYGSTNSHNRFCLWAKVAVDEFEKYRGFSILGREFVVYGGKAVKNTVICTVDNRKMEGIFYPVAEEEWLRVVPEMIYSNNRSKFWFLPVEFCLKFTRPKYNKPQSYAAYGLENEEWAKKGGLQVFDKYTNVDDVIPDRAITAANNMYNAGYRSV
jgi:hypothetical protein